MNFDNYSYLYVEDDSLSRISMKTVFERVMGVSRLTIFEDSTDFVDRVTELGHIPDLILLDIHVQPYTGFEMLQMLRKQEPYQECPVVALTASVMNEEIDQLRDAGFDSTIAKPFMVETFPGLIERILNGEAVWHIA